MKNMAVVSFGRFQPPHLGHGLLFLEVVRLASGFNGDPFVYASHTKNKKNPISYETKIGILNKIFPEVIKVDNEQKIKNIFDALRFLSGQYKNVIVVCGADRLHEYEEKINKYNGTEYSFESIAFASCGDRKILSTSGTEMRQLAIENNFDLFKKNLFPGVGDDDIKVMFDEIRSNLTF